VCASRPSRASRLAIDRARAYSFAIDPRYTITLARPRDVPKLAGIELAAATLLDGHAPASVLNESTDEAELREAQAEGRLWVALDSDVPVGFAHVHMLAPDMPHLEEVDVHPGHGRRGIGAQLVRAACDWAARSAHGTLTLTTFRALPFNMPFYAKLGFEESPTSALRPELAAVVRDEAARGLAIERRVVMSYRTKAGAGELP
jgi:GNAT superfamily N-acetyltransferase